uniref:Caspase domain-containing protein n=1 Tax=Candidatus Kentrum sp. FW TaxID=2126338 RepID=A0A450TF36_9GAMM|nr:MAG: Caspase domain-containing protein [Candidatus Kentron sp. FW]
MNSPVKMFLGILLFCLAAQVSFAAQTSSAAPGNARERIALVIGNAAYQSVALRNPVNDARDMAKALKESGFQVSLVTDADQKRMKSAIRAFGKRLTANTVGLFYFSGHGVQYQGRNYLIPIGVVSEVSVPDHLITETVDMGYALAVMKQSGSDLNIVVLDACRDSPFKSFFKSLGKGLARIDQSEGILIAYATSPGKVTLDGHGENSPYTKQLVRQIRKSDKPIELMLKAVRTAVKSDTGGMQVPWYEASIGGILVSRIQPRQKPNEANQQL